MTQYELVYLLFRNKWLILTGVLCGVIAAGAILKLKPRSYRSEAMLLVRYVSDSVAIDPEVSGKRVLIPGRANDTVIGTEVDILTSADLVSTVAKTLADADTNSASVPMTAREIALNFNVQVANNSSTIHVSFDGPSPESAQRTLAELIKVYLNKHLEVHKDPGAFEFISRQTDEMRTRINDTEDELRHVKEQAGIVSLPDSRAAVMVRIQDSARAIRENETALAATHARMHALSSHFSPATVSASVGAVTSQTPTALAPDVNETLRRMADLSRREDDLLRVYTTNSTPVRNVRQQIDDLRRVISRMAVMGSTTNLTRSGEGMARPMADVLTTDFATYQAEEEALLAQQAVLKAQLEAAQAESKRTEGAESQIVRLERMREIYDTNYRYFSQRLEHARIESAMDASKVSNIPLVEPPTLPDRPVTKGLKKLLAMVLAACTGCGLALAFAREYVFDHSIRHTSEIPRSLHIPLLAALPRIPQPSRRMSSSEAKGSKRHPTARQLDSACEVIAQLIREEVEHKEQTLRIGFTAPHAGAGVTTVAERIANSLQQSGIKKVLLAIVADDGQFIGRLLGETATTSQVEELPDAPPGTIGQPMTAEKRFPVTVTFSTPMAITQTLFNNLNQHDYDCVLFDLPPLGESEVAVRLLSKLDGVVLLLETMRTRRNQALDCVHQIRQLRCNIYGAVLNRFRSPVPAWLSGPIAETSPTAPAVAE